MSSPAKKKMLNLFESSQKASIRGKKSSSSRNSMTPSGSQRSLKLQLDSLKSENSSISGTPRTGFANESASSKPISLIIIEKYFSDICQSIADKGSIDSTFLAKASTMQEVLKDCLTAVSDLSLQFYVLMASALKEIQQINLTNDSSLYSALAKKLLQLASLIEENKYTSATERAITLPTEEVTEAVGLHNTSKELFVRINRVNVRVLNIWKKILCPQREAAVICCSFLLLFCEVDTSLKISPTERIPIDKAISSMKTYISNPGYVVTVIRRTKEYIDREMISVETIRRINDLISKITVDQVRSVDKTLAGMAIYELIVHALKYYQSYAKENYKFDIFNDSANEECSKSCPQIEAKSSARRESKADPNVASPKRQVTNQKLVPNKKPQILARPAQAIKPSQTQSSLKPQSSSPRKRPSHHEASRSSPKPIDRNIFSATKIISSSPVSRSAKSTPIRERRSEPQATNPKDVLEEMQYQQFIEEKFRHFLIDRLNKENSDAVAAGMDRNDAKAANEAKAVRNREAWVKDFEKSAGGIKFNATKKLLDERRYTAELIRAQRQLDILDRYS